MTHNSNPTIERTENCVFCDTSKIKGEITHHNEHVMSFEPLNPVTEGHRIFVSRKHVTDFFEDPDTYAEVSRVVSLCSTNLKEYNVITSKGTSATQSVFHLHIHLVPRTHGDGLLLPWTGKEAITTLTTKHQEELEKAVEETKKAIFSGNVVEYKCKFFKISDSDAWNFIQWDTPTKTDKQDDYKE